MPPLRTLRDGLGDEQLRVAILVGLATVPVTVALSVESIPDDTFTVGGTVSGEALLLAGVLVGYYYRDRPTETRRAGIWTGLAGSLGTLFVFGANTATGMQSASWLPAEIHVVLILVTLALGVGLTVLTTAIPAMVTGWVLTRLDRERRTAGADSRDGTSTSSATSRSKWRLSIVGYALLVPIAFGSMRWLEPAGGGGTLVAVLSLFLTIVLSFVTLIGLFADATEPRDPADWLPSVWLYVGGPIGAGALVYLVAAARGAGYPPGYGQYAFLGALWLASIAYLANGYRHRRRGRRGVGAI